MKERTVMICTSKGCQKRGCENNLRFLEDILKKKNLQETISIEKGFCHRLHQYGPILIIKPENILYPYMNEEKIRIIIEQHLINDQIVEDLLFKHPETGESIIHFEEAQKVSKELKENLNKEN